LNNQRVGEVWGGLGGRVEGWEYWRLGELGKKFKKELKTLILTLTQTTNLKIINNKLQKKTQKTQTKKIHVFFVTKF
jgi:hypothetical protein